jgi:acetyl esterase/lipase
MASEQMTAIAEAMRANRTEGPAPSVAAQRQAMESMQAALPVPEDVTIEDLRIDGRPARWVAAPGARPECAVLYLHGGGYVLGSLDTHREMMARVSGATQARVLGIDYRLAPEHPYPAALDDAVAGYRWLLERGLEPTRLLIAGDSAGGGLTVATLVKLRELGVPRPAAGVLFSPWTDLTGSGDSVRTRAAADPMIRPEMLATLAAHYHAATPASHPLVSPLFADLGGLPPLLVQVGEDEILLDDATRLAARAQAAGVTVELTVWSGAFHVFQMFPQLPEAAEALAQVARFARERLAA